MAAPSNKAAPQEDHASDSDQDDDEEHDDQDLDEGAELVMGAWESFECIPKQLVPPVLVSMMTDSLGFKAPTPIQVQPQTRRLQPDTTHLRWQRSAHTLGNMHSPGFDSERGFDSF